MAIQNLSYTKSWTNPNDFATQELTEAQVRADQQLLYDEIKAYINTVLIPTLMASAAAETSGASNIGANVGSVSTKTVQAILTAFEASLADRYTKAETNAQVKTNTDPLVQGVSFNDSTGDMTFTKKDGTTTKVNILTLIQHIPTDILFDQRYYKKAEMDALITEMEQYAQAAADGVRATATDAQTKAANALLSVIESEDFGSEISFDIVSGSYTLTAGWTYVPFPRTFVAPPQVATSAWMAGVSYTVMVKDITENGFYAAMTGVPTYTATTTLSLLGNTGYISTNSSSYSSSYTVYGNYVSLDKSNTASTTVSAGSTPFIGGSIQYIACLYAGPIS